MNNKPGFLATVLALSGDLIDLRSLKKPMISDGATIVGLGIREKACDDLASKIDSDKNLYAVDVVAMVDAFREALNAVRVDYFGDDLSLEEFTAIENLEGNTHICKQIEAGKEDLKFADMTYLPARVASEISKIEEFYKTINFFSLKKISAAAALALSNVKENGPEDYVFYVLEEIDLEVAKAFGENFSGYLDFPLVSQIDPTVAGELAKFQGCLALSGLRNMNGLVAKELANQELGELSLGLRKIGIEAAKELSRYKGQKLELECLDDISTETAAELIKIKGELGIATTAKISLALAEVLAKRKGDLRIVGIGTIDVEVAKNLSQVQGYLDLLTLEKLSVDEMKALCSGHIGAINIGINSLNEPMAEAIVKNQGDLKILKVSRLSDEAALILARHALTYKIEIVDRVLRGKIEKYMSILKKNKKFQLPRSEKNR